MGRHTGKARGGCLTRSGLRLRASLYSVFQSKESFTLSEDNNRIKVIRGIVKCPQTELKNDILHLWL